MKCLKCGEDWELPNGKVLKFCPGCGANVATAETGAADNIIGRIIKQYGDAILLERRKMLSLVADMIGNENPNQLRRIRLVINEGVLAKIYELKSARKEERVLRLITIAGILVDGYGMKEELAYEVVNYFSAALGFETIRAAIEEEAERPIMAAEVTVQQTMSVQKEASVRMPTAVSRMIEKKGDIVRFGAYDWRVLDIQNGTALLLSDKILKVMNFGENWENSNIREYLNGEFYNTLGMGKSAIKEDFCFNFSNPWYDTYGGTPTLDKVFLLSLDEVIEYFGDSGDVKNMRRVVFNQSQYMSVSDPKGDRVSDQYNANRIAKLSDEAYKETIAIKREVINSHHYFPWWLRTIGCKNNGFILIGMNGGICIAGESSIIRFGVRPALRIDIKSYNSNRF